MKRYWLAAGTLLLSTSTIAWAQTDAKTDPANDKTVAASKETSVDKSVWTDKTAYDSTGDKMALTSWQSKDAGADAKLQTASFDDWSDPSVFAAKSTSPGWDEKSGAESWVGTKTAAFEGQSGLQKSSFETWSDADNDAKVHTAALDKTGQTGMGGPLESAYGASPDLSPRVATENYPPCSPGPGDDRCIQLYEPGVRAQLAAWNSPTGGLAEHSATTAMGGPYEPVEGSDSQMASVAADHDMEMAWADTDPQLADHGQYQGVGGPIEAQSGYPPCSPGPGDDRCIQLYESGVTGAGN